METLITDCLPPIFSYLPLADLLHLRTVSRRLKQEVEDYLPTVRSLPLYLTTPRTPEAIARYENMCISFKEMISSIDGTDYSDLLSDDYICYRRLPFGTSGLGAFEDATILQNQKHFRRSDFLILNNSSTLFKFLPFIKKLCPNIEKLAMVIDHCDHYLPEVSKVLEAFPAIKVLLLERTMQDSCRHYDSAIKEPYPEDLISLLPNRPINFMELPAEVFSSILGLNRLEELFFFPKRQCQLAMNSRAGGPEYNFLRSLLGRLKVLHVNSRGYLIEIPVNCGREEPLEELAFPSDSWLHKRFMFPSLTKFILLKPSWSFTTEYSSFPRPSLKVLDISNDVHSICPISTQNLNNFASLESFHCGSITFPLNWRNTAKRRRHYEEYIEPENVPENLKNRTIKHLQIMAGPKTAEERNREVRQWSKYFVKLETCTFLEPEYSVVRVADLLNR